MLGVLQLETEKETTNLFDVMTYHIGNDMTLRKQKTANTLKYEISRPDSRLECTVAEQNTIHCLRPCVDFTNTPFSETFTLAGRRD